jgi:hypothetical protein
MERNTLGDHFSWRFWLATAGACVAAGLICLDDFQQSRLLDPLTISSSRPAQREKYLCAFSALRHALLD